MFLAIAPHADKPAGLLVPEYRTKIAGEISRAADRIAQAHELKHELLPRPLRVSSSPLPASPFTDVEP
jgi:hypothetical protein